MTMIVLTTQVVAGNYYQVTPVSIIRQCWPGEQLFAVDGWRWGVNLVPCNLTPIIIVSDGAGGVTV